MRGVEGSGVGVPRGGVVVEPRFACCDEFLGWVGVEAVEEDKEAGEEGAGPGGRYEGVISGLFRCKVCATGETLATI